MSHPIVIRSAVAALLLSLFGCVPAVAHSPRVWPGVSFGGSVSATAGPRYENGDDGPSGFLFGPVGLDAAYGWAAATNALPSVRVAVHVPVPFVAIVQPDLYIQAPRRITGGLDAGVGVSFVAAELGRVAMPYLQVGAIGHGGSGWYTTHGFYSNTRNVSQTARPVLKSTAWVPSVAYAVGGRQRTTHFFLTGVLGELLSRCNAFSNEVCKREERWAVFGGLSLELHRPRSPR